MSIVTHLQYSVEDYFEAERASELRHEYLDGEISTMVGGSRAHNEILSNLYRILLTGVSGSEYRVCCGNTRVKIPTANAYLYPNVAVAIGRGEYEPDRLDTLLNPSLIVEVLSQSTRKFDQGEKFELYKKIESLTEYVLVSQDTICIERFVRQESGAWISELETDRNIVIPLTSIPYQFSIETVYEYVEFEP